MGNLTDLMDAALCRPKIHIKVFATKTHEFRAIIKPEGGFASEITVGGQRWKDGEYADLQDRIRGKCRSLLVHLANNLTAAGGIAVSEAEEYSRAEMERRIEAFGIACYKRGFQERHGSQVVKKWKRPPEIATVGLVRDFLKKMRRGA